jgi:hypothetical protein
MQYDFIIENRNLKKSPPAEPINSPRRRPSGAGPVKDLNATSVGTKTGSRKFASSPPSASRQQTRSQCPRSHHRYSFANLRGCGFTASPDIVDFDRVRLLLSRRTSDLEPSADNERSVRQDLRQSPARNHWFQAEPSYSVEKDCSIVVHGECP